MTSRLPLRRALREAVPIPVSAAMVDECVDVAKPADALFVRVREGGLAATPRGERRGLAQVTGDVAESVAEMLLVEAGSEVFWHLDSPGAHGVDLLVLTPDECVVALEAKGTLRPGVVPRLTPSRLRQMSREWLNGPDNPGMAEHEFEADDLYAAVMVVDLALDKARVAVSGDFEAYLPLRDLAELRDLAGLLG